MKIGIDARLYGPKFTGIGRYLQELLKRLPALDTANQYVFFFNEPEFSEYVVSDEWQGRVEKRRVCARHYSFAEQWTLPREFGKARVDLMHFPHFNAPIFYRRPSVVTVHDLTVTFFPGKRMRASLYRAAYHMVLASILKRSRAVVAVSEHTKQDIVQYFHIPAEKITVTYEAADARFKPLPKDAGFLGGRPYLLYTGVWRSHKNVLGLLEAFSFLKKNHDWPGALVMSGDQKLYPEVKDKVRELGLDGAVVFPGFVQDEDLPKYYAQAMAYVFPSFYEGFGLPVLEAFACGTPVVASNASSIPEIAGEGNALFFDPYNMEEMAEAMWKIISDTSLRTSLRERGLKRAGEFSWDRMAKETLAVYAKAAS